jgi:diguanylate cyclase (GGDEF)-like protein/PAS domain S-box-containing protein
LLYDQLISRLDFSEEALAREKKQTSNLAVQESLSSREVLEYLHSGISITNEEGIVIFWNSALEKITGLKVSDVLNMPLWDVQFMMLPKEKRTKEEYAAFKSGVQKFLKTGKSPWLEKPYTLNYLHPAGHKCVVEAQFSSVKTTKGHILIGVSQDITQPFHAEAALRESEKKFRSVIEQANEGIILLDDKGIIVEWNPAMQKITGIKPKEVIGQPIVEATLHIDPPKLNSFPFQQAEFQQLLVAVSGLATFDEPQIIEKEVKWEEITRTIQVQGFPIQIGERRMVGCIVRDISDQKGIEKSLKRYAYQLETLRQVGLELAAELSLDTLLWMIAPRAIELLGGAAMALYVHDPKNEHLELAICLGDTQPPIEQSVKLGQGLAGYLWERAEPMLIEDFHTGATGKLTRSMWGKVAGSPIVYGGEFLGVIFVFSDQPFNVTDLKLLGLFASHAGAAIRNARLHAELHELAIRDSLTGIFNRRHFFELSEKAFMHARRYKRPLSALIFDLDHYKNVNDHYGHLIGDKVLHDLAQRCVAVVRLHDIFGRYGGEEFAVVLPETDLQGVLSLGERLREVIAESPFDTDHDEVQVTVSVGIARMKRNTTSLMQLLSDADKALYRAKNGGRNSISE